MIALLLLYTIQEIKIFSGNTPLQLKIKEINFSCSVYIFSIAFDSSDHTQTDIVFINLKMQTNKIIRTLTKTKNWKKTPSNLFTNSEMTFLDLIFLHNIIWMRSLFLFLFQLRKKNKKIGKRFFNSTNTRRYWRWRQEPLLYMKRKKILKCVFGK